MRSTIVAISIVLVTMASIISPPPLLLIWNATASTPVGLYAVTPAVPKRGDLLLTRLPREMELLAVSRRILSANTPVLKPVAAIAGDLVCRAGPVISINGGFAATARERDGHGRPLPTWRGCRRLSAFQVFVLARDAHSFDSRYYGPVDVRLARGIARPLLTFLN